jgi:hypothetical protein
MRREIYTHALSNAAILFCRSNKTYIRAKERAGMRPHAADSTAKSSTAITVQIENALQNIGTSRQ